MNIQAMMQQAQQLQKKMIQEKEEIGKMNFEGKSSFVTAVMNGNKEMISLKIDNDSISFDDKELLEDMIVIATNNAMKEIDKITDEKMGKYTKGIPGF